MITQPKKSDPFGNPQIDPIPRDDVPKFYADFYNTPNALNNGHTINGYWMEQSGGKVGITDVTTVRPVPDAEAALPVRPQRLRPGRASRRGNGCPAATTVTGAQHGDADDRGRRLGVLLRRRHRHVRRGHPDRHQDGHRDPGRDAHHGQRADHGRRGTTLQDCMDTNFNTDATALWNADTGCAATNCGATSTCSSTPATTRPRSGRSSAR